MSGITQAQVFSATAQALEGTENVTVQGAPGTGKRLWIQKGYIIVLVAATGAGGGEVALEDGSGGTRFIEADADAVGYHPFDFGEPGFPLALDTLLNLTVDQAATNEATARVVVVGVIM